MVGNWIYTNGGIPFQITEIKEKGSRFIFIGVDIFGSSKTHVCSFMPRAMTDEELKHWKEKHCK